MHEYASVRRCIGGSAFGDRTDGERERLTSPWIWSHYLSLDTLQWRG
jgi:hypothetical protein